MNLPTLALFGYILVQLAIGVYVSRRVRTEEDYLVAGRSLGYGLATFTIFATWFGAETCIGAAGSIYERGLSGGTADPFGYAACLLLMGLAFAVPLRRLRITTLGDVFRRRFSPGVERLAVVLMVPTSLLWAAAQIRAFGQVLAVSSGLEIGWTISVAAGVVVVYTMSGGLLADAWTDVVQGVALIVGLAVLAVAVVGDEGLETLAAVSPERLRLSGGPGTPLLAVVEAWAVPICGSVLAAELVARVIATRSPTIARRSSIVAGAGYLLVGAIPVVLGLVGAVVLPGLEHGEQILPRLAEGYLPPVLYPVFAGALVSAILSTVDSALLAAASLVSHNLIVSLRPGLPERVKLGLARAGVVVFGILSYGMALHAEGVYALVEEASAFASSGIFVVLVLGMFTRIGGTASAFAALVGGASVWIAGAYVMELPYPYLTSLVAALVAFAIPAAVGHPHRRVYRRSS
jgi:Na+/proline symporter